ncbi:PPOX class F420-dependent oxidoreductase [Kineococcus gypseus]|uniref:PPOX class F420-dependent oxidoreductase n=1 Tax=Kineococcus gypseus TaxID=1637102 RepID=UPI003D7F0D45
MSATWPEGLGQSKCVLLTTFTRDGRPKPTPVWFTLDGERLLVYTEPGSWKVRRLRHTPQVRVRACTLRGRPTGPEVEARARLLDEQEAQAVLRAVLGRYPVAGRFFRLTTRLSRARTELLRHPAGIEVVLPGTARPATA